ncbi:1-acyl-sn-glycerol-3-phosphate acyltransferase [Deltaproteobacteria bacterium]|nr:1-acyl-sn-glycerol-3-phosphate acyltransferase [Deltaproteobacteria bacterium]
MKNNRGKIYYPYVLDHKPGFFLGWLLYRLFKKVNLDVSMKEALKQMQREGTVVYAIKYRGLLDYLLYHYAFRKRRLPYPKIAFDMNISLVLPLGKLFQVVLSQVSSFFRYGKIPSPYKTGFYGRAIRRRTPALISLVDPRGFIKSFVFSEKDHLQFLLETQKQMDRPIFIVPQLILFKRTPEKNYSTFIDTLFGYKDHTGLIRKIILFFRHYRTTLIDFGRPLDLKAYLETQPPSRPLDDMATEIRHLLIESIDSQKRIILGPIMKSRQQLKEIVLKDENLNNLIEDIASGDFKKLRQERKNAGKYFDEIAADYNNTYVYFFRLALSWLWKRIFEGIDTDKPGIAKVREFARRGSLVFIPSHKSHIDYLALNYVLYENLMHIPRVAAGQNLAFWPIGYIFRKAGAFFIRRTFKGAKLYSEVFTRYVKALLEEGHPIEFYIEGGRSRNGKMLLPKIGFLSILLQAYHEGYCNDLIFVPASIIYDRIIEKSSYLKEINGASKKKENLKQFMGARRFLKRRYGKIYLRFNEPFSLKEYLLKKNLEVKDVHQDLANHITSAINQVSLVTPLSLVSTAILTKHRKGFLISELQETVDTLMNFLNRYNIPASTTLNDPSRAVLETISLLTSWKVVDFMDDAPGEEETFYFVEDEKKMELEYYKNNIIHFFIHHSIVALSFLTGDEEEMSVESVISNYVFLKFIFSKEFIFNEEDDIPERVTSIIEYFMDSGFLTLSEGGDAYKITRQGFDNLPMWSALAKTFIESYRISAKVMGQNKDKKETLESLLKNITYLAKRYHKMGIIEHIGAISRINFKNAVTLINQEVLKVSENPESNQNPDFEKLTQLTKKLYDLSQKA